MSTRNFEALDIDRDAAADAARGIDMALLWGAVGLAECLGAFHDFFEGLAASRSQADVDELLCDLRKGLRDARLKNEF